MNPFDQRGQKVGVQLNANSEELKIEIERLAKHARKAIKDGRLQDADEWLVKILKAVG